MDFNSRRRALGAIGGALTLVPGGSLWAAVQAREASSSNTSSDTTVSGSTLSDKAVPDKATLQALSESASELDQLNSLLIMHRGEVRLDETFRGVSTNELVNVKSVSKTLLATLVGIALDKGDITSVDQTLGELAPGLIPAKADPEVARITLRHLLSMQSGLQRTSGRNYGVWVNSPDWVAYVLTRPFVSAPGSRMLYSTGNYHVLGAVLTVLTGKSLLELSREWLGEPLDIEFAAWTRDPQGYYLGGNEMALSAHSLAVFGELFRQGGMHNAKRVVSEAWIEQAWMPLTRSPFSGHAYGLGWFLALVDGHQTAYARGYGGQLLYVIPTLGLTVVITSDTRRPARSGAYMDSLNDLLAERIVPAFA